MSLRKNVFSVLCLLMAFLLAIFGVSCAFRVSAEELSAGYTRKAADEGEMTAEFCEAMVRFSFSLLRGSLAEGKNTLISPYSAYACLAMLQNGAAGNTLSEMQNVLGLSSDALNRGIYAYTKTVSAEKGLITANSLWVTDDESLTVNPSFLQTNADWFGAQIYSAPMNGKTKKDVNAWANHYTDGQIKEAIDTVDPDTLMLLVNAVSFDAVWANPFTKESVREETFRNADGTEISTPMLHGTESYLKIDGAEGFYKRYESVPFAYIALLPEEGTEIGAFLDSVTPENWQKTCSSMKTYSPEVKITMPTFRFDDETDLKAVLQSLGMADAFDSAAADFSALGSSTAGNIYASRAFQKTSITLDNCGTKAGAVTVIEMKVESAPAGDVKKVDFDRPFVFAVVDTVNGLPVFLGTVENL